MEETMHIDQHHCKAASVCQKANLQPLTVGQMWNLIDTNSLLISIRFKSSSYWEKKKIKQKKQ